eukprot:PRCOL_00005168-RA
MSALVVRELLARGDVARVRALVRDGAKAEAELPSPDDEPRLEVVNVDLADVDAAGAAFAGAGAAVWCAQGDGRASSTAQKATGFLGTLARALRMRLTGNGGGDGSGSAGGASGAVPTGSRAVQPTSPTALDAAAEALAASGGRLVLLSSAAVTRNAWKERKREELAAVVDIPIVRLNPFGVLDQGRLAEQRVRESGAQYAVVRPVGLRDTDGAKSWPRGRPWLAQHDVLVGRANREDVAAVCVEAALAPAEAVAGKTFEMMTLVGEAYPAPKEGLEYTFSLLYTDEQRAAMGEDVGFGVDGNNGDTLCAGELAVRTSFLSAQQMLPGEVQDATRLEMGRTYEQLDAGKVDRKPGAAPTEREVKVATGAAAR